MTTVQISQKELAKLRLKAKSGWRKYFVLRDEYESLCDFVNEVRQKSEEMIQRSEQKSDCTYLKTQYVEMYEKLREYTDCPVCLQTLRAQNIHVPLCGHILCVSCHEKIKSTENEPKCPKCRKIY